MTTPTRAAAGPDESSDRAWLAMLLRLARVTFAPSHAWMWFGYYPILVPQDRRQHRPDTPDDRAARPTAAA